MADVYAWLNCSGLESVPIRDDPILIGRSKDAGLVLQHGSVSRRHAIVAHRLGHFRVKNLSGLGLEVNGTTVEGLAPLRMGDTLTIGAFELRIEDFPERRPGEEDVVSTVPIMLSALTTALQDATQKTQRQEPDGSRPQGRRPIDTLRRPRGSPGRSKRSPPPRKMSRKRPRPAASSGSSTEPSAAPPT